MIDKAKSPTNIGYIKRFYLLYNQVLENYPQLVGKSVEDQMSYEYFFADVTTTCQETLFY